MELLLFDNMLETVPPSLFEMKSLEMLNLDRNHLIEVPATVSACWGSWLGRRAALKDVLVQVQGWFY